jgi:hypothetical protein
MNNPNSRCFKEITTDIKASGPFTVPPRTFGYLFCNKGDTGVWVMDHFLKPYPPGQQFLSGEAYGYTDDDHHELNLKSYQVNFDNTIVPSANVDQWVEVTFFYNI